jgi:hypothetical protein
MINADDIRDMRPEITKEMFKKATGLKPSKDDLERSNCKSAGETGHYYCGWNWDKNLPQFMTEPHPNIRNDR